eukprot:1392024-Amorphochlora_amoeboformis.AAC.1
MKTSFVLKHLFAPVVFIDPDKINPNPMTTVTSPHILLGASSRSFSTLLYSMESPKLDQQASKRVCPPTLPKTTMCTSFESHRSYSGEIILIMNKGAEEKPMHSALPTADGHPERV